MIRIAIDPDINKSGVAIMINGKLDSLQSLAFIDLTCEIERNFGYKTRQTMAGRTSDVYYCIEDVESIKPVWHRAKVSQNAMLKIAQGVGMAKAVGRLIGQHFYRCDMGFELIPPLKGHLKRGKKDADFFNKLMGWSGRSNADNRDAALLLYPFLKKG